MNTSLILGSNFLVETSLSLDLQSLTTLKQALSLTQAQLQASAIAPEFNYKLGLAFGGSETLLQAVRLNFTTAESLRQQWLTEDFKTLPIIEILSGTELQGAKGAFSWQTNRIYLSADFIHSSLRNSQLLSQVLLEEIGHFVDTQINSVDAPGDEGAIFSALVSNGNLDSQELQSLKLEDDHATLILNGQTVQVELADAYQGKNLGTIIGGLQTVLTNLNTSLKTVALANKLPLVGTALKDVTDPALDFLNQLKNQLATLNTSSVTQVQQTLFNSLGSGGLNWLRDRNGNGILDLNDIAVNDTANQVTFNFTLGKNPTSLTGGIGFDLGLPGLGLTVSDNSKVKTDIGFSFDLGFGANKDTGFFFDTSPSNELKVNLNTTLPGFNATGKLGFLQVGVKDNPNTPTNFAGTFGLDLQNGFTVAPTFNGQANINLSLLGKIPTTSDTSIPLLPSIGTDLSLQWGFSNANASNPLSSTFGNLPQLAFNNVNLNIGSFMSRFVSPILGKVQDALSPLKPVIDFLNKDLPLLDLSIVDLLTTAKQIIPPGLPGAGNVQSTSGLQVLKYLDTILNIPSAPNVPIKLGDFNLGSSRDIRTQLLKDIDVNSFTSILNDIDQALRAIGADNAANYLRDLSKGLDNRGLTFPLIQNPKEALKLLLGQDPELFRWDLSDTLRFGDQDGGFYGRGIGARIDYQYSGGLNLVLGYDTYGLRRFFDTNFNTPSLLGDGFYLVDGPNSEAYLNAGFFAGAGVGIEGANLSVGGAIDGNINLEINDPNNDGKLRPSEVDDCFLEGSGQIDASLQAKLVLGWGLFKIQKTFPITKGTLLSFAAGCQKGDPVRNVLAKVESGNLVLLMGPRAGERVINGSSPGSQQDVAEYFVLRPTAGQSGRVDVLAFGAIVSYVAGNQIIANGGLQGDVIAIDAAIATPANLQGEAGADQLMGGAGNDTLLGGVDDDLLDGGGGADRLDGGDGFDAVSYATSNTAIQIAPGSNGSFVGSGGTANGDILLSIEQVTGSNFNDTLNGDGANNTFDGGAGNDNLKGNDGNDLLLGGAGADTLDGGSGSDVVSYIDSSAGVNVNLLTKATSGGDATGDLLISIENAEGSQLADILNGDNASNLLSGQGGDDQLFGNGGNDTLDGGRDNDILNGGDGQDILYGKVGGDTLNGDAGNDVLNGGANADTLNGGDGIDTADYSSSPSEVIVNLATGTANGRYKSTFINNAYVYSLVSDAIVVSRNPVLGTDIVTGDRLTNIENIIGSQFRDNLIGDDKDNIFIPGLARTNISYGHSFDLIDGGSGNDLLIIDYSVGEDATTGAMTGGTTDVGSGRFQRYTADGSTWVDGFDFQNIEHLQVTATSKNDFLMGLLGDDTLNGGAGNDTLFGSNSTNGSNIGNDVINGGDGNDEISHRRYNAVGFDADLLDRFDGGAGNDVLSADFSNQTADITFISGQSNNIIFADGAYAKNFENVRYLTTGSGNDKIIQRGQLPISPDTNNRWNKINTGAGNDTIDAGLGDGDSVDGGEGNDLLIIDYSVGDDATAAGLNGGITFTSSLASYERRNLDNSARDRISAANIERYNITGTSKADNFTGFDRDDTLIGGAGNDTINAYYGNDIVDAGSGNDEVSASYQSSRGISGFNDSSKLDKLDGGTGFDTLTADFGNQTVDINFNSVNPTNFLFGDGTYAKNFEIIKNLQTGSGNDTLIQSGRLDNNFVTGAGNDTINAGLGADVVDGGAGDDLLIIDYSVGDDANTGAATSFDSGFSGSFSRNTATNARLDSIIYSNIERLQVTGTSKNDYLTGSSTTADTFIGGAGNDTLYGGDGNDNLEGGSGDDSLIGGRDNDRFIFRSGRAFNPTDLGIDTIADFEVGKDKLALDPLTFTAGTTFASVASDAVAASSNAFIVYSSATGNLFYNPNGSANDFGNGGQFAILNNRPTLSATDFGTFIQATIFAFSAANFSVNEHGTPVTAITITRTGNTTGTASVTLTPSNGTAIAPNDFTNTPIVVNFANGQTSKTVTIPIVNDGLIESNETLTLTLSNATNGASLGTQKTALLTIINNDTSTGLNITGSNSNDILNGGNGNDTINGGAGNDTIIGGTGNDTIRGEAGNDALAGGDGNDAISGGDGNDRIRGNAGNDTIDGGNGIDTLVESGDFNYILTNTNLTGSGTDNFLRMEKAELTGGIGNNTLNASAFTLGSVTLNGGSGNDTMMGGLGNDTMRGEVGNDAIAGNDGNDAISGGDGNDRIRGNAGNDTIDGGNGIDTLVESGDLSFNLTNTNLIGNGTDNFLRIEQVELTGGIGNNTINASAFTLGSVTLNGGSGNDTMMGGLGNDTMRGEAGNDAMSGGDGNDAISGGDGNDRIAGGAGNDTIDGGNGIDTIIDSANVNFTLSNTKLTGNGTDSFLRIEQAELTDGIGNNTLNASAFTLGSVTLNGGSGNDTMMGGSGNDIIRGEVGNDAMSGGDGNDAISGGDGNDRIRGNAGNDTIDGGNGIDTFAETGDFNYILTNTNLTGNGNDSLIRIEQVELTGGIGNNTLNASAFTLGAVTLNGGDGNDTLTGGSSNDILTRGNGNDILTGGLGNDTLTGGAGSDRFTFNAANQGIDKVNDFNVVDDTIVVSAAGFGGGLVANAAITAAQFVIGASATNVSQRFIYNNTTGGLFFDIDGNGVTSQIQLATLTTGLAMTNNDIFVIA